MVRGAYVGMQPDLQTAAGSFAVALETGRLLELIRPHPHHRPLLCH